MTKEEILEGIREGKFSITDLFSADEITASEPAKKAKQTEYEHAKRIEKSLGEEREKVITLTKSVEEKDTKIKDLNTRVSSTQVKTLFDTAHGVRKFNDKEKAFIEKNMPGFKSDKEGDALKLDFDKFLDSQIKDFQDYAKLMGIKVEDAPAAGTAGAGDGKGTPATDGKGNGSDLSKPENNDLIPKE